MKIEEGEEKKFPSQQVIKCFEFFSFFSFIRNPPPKLFNVQPFYVEKREIEGAYRIANSDPKEKNGCGT